MKDKQIQEFLTKVAQIEAFKQEFFNFAEYIEKNKDVSEESREKFITTVLMPWSKKLGYNFSVTELISFDKSQSSESLTPLPEDSMEKVSGGTNMLGGILKTLLSFIVGMGQGSVKVAPNLVKPVEYYTASGEEQDNENYSKMVNIYRDEMGKLNCYCNPELFSRFYRGLGSIALSFESRLDFAWRLTRAELNQLQPQCTEEEIEYVRSFLEWNFLNHMAQFRQEDIKNYFLKKQKQLIVEAWLGTTNVSANIENFIVWEMSETEDVAVTIKPELLNRFGYLMLTAPVEKTLSRIYALSSMILNDLTLRHGEQVFANLGIVNPHQFIFEKIHQQIVERFPYSSLATAWQNMPDGYPAFVPPHFGGDMPIPSAPPWPEDVPEPSAPPAEEVGVYEPSMRPTEEYSSPPTYYRPADIAKETSFGFEQANNPVAGAFVENGEQYPIPTAPPWPEDDSNIPSEPTVPGNFPEPSAPPAEELGLTPEGHPKKGGVSLPEEKPESLINYKKVKQAVEGFPGKLNIKKFSSGTYEMYLSDNLTKALFEALETDNKSELEETISRLSLSIRSALTELRDGNYPSDKKIVSIIKKICSKPFDGQSLSEKALTNIVEILSNYDV